MLILVLSLHHGSLRHVVLLAVLVLIMMLMIIGMPTPMPMSMPTARGLIDRSPRRLHVLRLHDADDDKPMKGGVDMWDAGACHGMSVTILEKHHGHHRPDHQARAVRAISRR